MKFNVLVIVFSVVAMNVQAQGITGGLKAGLNVAHQDISTDGESWDTSARVGAHFGIFATFMISEKFGLQPEILYSSQGSKLEDETGKFSYFNIPVLMQVNFTEAIHLHVGPQIGFLLNAEAEGDDGTVSLKDLHSNLDASIATGLGIETKVGLGFGARYSFGLLDIRESSSIKCINNNLQFYMYFRMNGGED